jgi:hypothetical protein
MGNLQIIKNWLRRFGVESGVARLGDYKWAYFDGKEMVVDRFPQKVEGQIHEVEDGFLYVGKWYGILDGEFLRKERKVFPDFESLVQGIKDYCYGPKNAVIWRYMDPETVISTRI